MRWSCQRKCCHRRHPSIKGIFVSSPPLRLSPLPCLITLLVCCDCHCQWFDVAALLACMEPSFDTVPWRLHCVVLMGCWRLVCGGQWARIKKRSYVGCFCLKTPQIRVRGGHVFPYVLVTHRPSTSQQATAHSCHTQDITPQCWLPPKSRWSTQVSECKSQVLLKFPASVCVKAWFWFDTKCRSIKRIAQIKPRKDRPFMQRSHIAQVLVFRAAVEEVAHGRWQRTHASHSWLTRK